MYLYLEGATPTRFGPRPRNSDLGPSFSSIDLKQNEATVKTQIFEITYIQVVFIYKSNCLYICYRKGPWRPVPTSYFMGMSAIAYAKCLEIPAHLNWFDKVYS